MTLTKHEYTTDATTGAVNVKEAEASLIDVINPSITLVDPVSRVIRFSVYTLLFNRLFSQRGT